VNGIVPFALLFSQARRGDVPKSGADCGPIPTNFNHGLDGGRPRIYKPALTTKTLKSAENKEIVGKGKIMAQHVSAKKRIRQTKRRTGVNVRRLSRIRTHIRSIEEAINGGDQKKAIEMFQLAQPEMMRGARRGIVHKNMVSRKLSRLSARIKNMAA
jgi:small subunit ribosomal protein S20